MITNITFKYLERGNVVHKTIPIEHPDFEVLPAENFMGYTFMPRSIESQVIEYLDSIDKSDLMARHDMQLILDYYVPKSKSVKKTIDEEVIEFFDYLRPYVDPSLYRPIEAVVYEARDVLFGKGKSIKTKVKEVTAMLGIANKSILGTLNLLDDIFSNELRLENHGSKENDSEN